MHLRQPRFTYSAFGLFTKTKESIKKNKETGDSGYIYQNELDKACFQHDMVYGDFKDLKSDKVLRDEAFNIAKDPKYDGYQPRLVSIFDKCFDKKVSGSGIKNENISNKELSEELRKPVIRKFNKRIVHSPFIDNIWDVELADMILISKINKVFRFLFCVINIYSKYAWVIPLKDRKGITISNAFQKIF